jgi:hypothetical protein
MKTLKEWARPNSELPPPEQWSYTRIVISELLKIDPGTHVSLTRLLVSLSSKYGGTPLQWRARVKNAFYKGSHRVTTLRWFMMMSVGGVAMIMRGTNEKVRNTA